MKQDKLRIMVVSAMLVALSFVVAMFFPKFQIPPAFSYTIASHVPTLIACFVNPWAALLTAVGAAVGFFFSTGNPLIVARALVHAIFAVLLWFFLKKGMNRFLALGISGVIHGLSEALVVLALVGPLAGFKVKVNGEIQDLLASGTLFYYSFIIVGVGTVISHVIDSVITLPCVTALEKARLIPRIGLKKPAAPKPDAKPSTV